MDIAAPDPWEESARIVEAFATGAADEEAAELYAEIARAIRDRATDS